MVSRTMPDQHGHHGQEMNEPPLASMWVGTLDPFGELFRSHLVFSSVQSTSSTSLRAAYLYLLIFSILLFVMAVGRRLSKRRPKKEQPQTVNTQSLIEPAVGETAQDGSITHTPKHRVPPTKAELDKVANFCVEDADGNKIPFRRLYEEQPRVLLIFIRHFFCGVRTLTYLTH